MEANKSRRTPFSDRRATAEFLLQRGAGVNDMKNMEPRDPVICGQPGTEYPETALMTACVFED